jgi:hypothetical protein
MGKFNSAFTFTGKVGQIHGYNRGGNNSVTFVGCNGGPTKEQFLNAPSLELTRQNSKEFGGAALGAKEFYFFVPLEIRRHLGASYRFLLRDFVKLIHANTSGIRGQRTILVYEPLGWFNSIITGQNLSYKFFNNLVNSIFTVTPSPSRDACEVVFTGGIQPTEILSYPGATHIKVFISVFGISNCWYNPLTKSYQPITDVITKNVADSGFIDITTGSGAPVDINAFLDHAPSADQACIAHLWVNYYEFVLGEYKLLDNTGDVILTAF